MAGTRTVYEGQPISRRGAHTVNDFKRSTCSTSGCPGRGGSLTAPSWNNNLTARSYVYCANVHHSVPDHVVDDMARVIAADKLAGFVTKGAQIHGHRCVSGKSCPGDKMWAVMAALQSRIKHYLRIGLNGDDDMPTAKEIADAVWAKALTSEVSDKAVSARTLLQKAHLYSYGAQRSTLYPLGSADGPTPRQAWSRAEARTSALLALVAEIIDRDPSTPLTGDQVKAIVEKAIADNVVKVDVTIEGVEPEPTES